MSDLITLNNLISEIHKKILLFQKKNSVVTKKEVEDFIYFLMKSN